MPRNPTTGVFTRPVNSFSDPVLGEVIDPNDATSLFNDYDAGLNNIPVKITDGTTPGSVLFVGPAPDNLIAEDSKLFWDGTAHQLGVGTNTPLASTSLDAEGNSFFNASGTLLSRPYPSFHNAPDGAVEVIGGTQIEATIAAPNTSGVALVAQGTCSGTGITSGGSAVFGAVNSTTDGAWDGFGIFTVLNNPISQLTPAGGSTWATLRGSRSPAPGVASPTLDAVRATSEMSYTNTVTFNTTTDAVLLTAHALLAGDPVAFTTTGTLPTPLVSGTKYFVKTVLTADSFTLSATSGGALIDLGGSPAATTTMSLFQNATRGVIVFNSNSYNAFLTGVQVASAVNYGFQVGDANPSSSHIVPTHPFSYYNNSSSELYYVTSTGATYTTDLLSVKQSANDQTSGSRWIRSDAVNYWSSFIGGDNIFRFRYNGSTTDSLAFDTTNLFAHTILGSSVTLTETAAANQDLLILKSFDNTGSSTPSLAFENSSGTPYVRLFSDASSNTTRFKSVGPISLHTSDAGFSTTGQALTIDTSQLIKFNAYGAGFIKSDASGNLTSSAISASDLSNGVTGSGPIVLANTPTLVTPVLGVATATSINKVALTAPATAATITITNNKTFAVTNTLTLSGTDSTVMTFPTTSATIARTDAANTFTGHQTIEGVTSTGATGTGKFVFDGTPTLVTPNIGVATGSSLTMQAPSNTNTKFIVMKASNDADTAIMAIAMQNASGTDKMIQWTDAASATYRFKSASTLAFHTNSVAVSTAGAAITLSTAQAVQFNAYGVGVLSTDASGNITASDERIKNISGSYTGGLDVIAKIKPIRFAFKTTPDVQAVGLSAQNVEASLPEAIGIIPLSQGAIDAGVVCEDGCKNLDDRALIATLINAVNELANENADCKRRLAALELA